MPHCFFAERDTLSGFLGKFNEGVKFTVSGIDAFFAGMRFGEMAALKWENVDFKKEVIKVREGSAFMEKVYHSSTERDWKEDQVLTYDI